MTKNSIIFKFKIDHEFDITMTVEEILNSRLQHQYNEEWFEQFAAKTLAELSRAELNEVAEEYLKDLIYGGVVDFDYTVNIVKM
jgi:hypothetical protein